jgi:hypothetical protein
LNTIQPSSDFPLAHVRILVQEHLFFLDLFPKFLSNHGPPLNPANPLIFDFTPFPFKVQDLPEDLTLTLNLLITPTIKPAFPIFSAVTIPTSALIFFTPESAVASS